MTENYQRAQKTLQRLERIHDVPYDDIIFLKSYIETLLNENTSIEKPSIEKPNANLQSTEDPLPNDNIKLEDVPPLNTNDTSHENPQLENANHANENSQLKNAQDDPNTINDAKYNLLITLPFIILSFEDILTTYLLSKYFNAFLIFYVLFISAVHSALAFAILYYKDKKKRRSLFGALFAGFISIGKITGEISRLVFAKKKDDKTICNEVIQSAIRCSSALVFYLIIATSIYMYQTNCCRNRRNIEFYH